MPAQRYTRRDQCEGMSEVTRDGDTIRVGVAVSGDGYNGDGAFTFDLKSEKIARMVITGEPSEQASADHAQQLQLR